MTAPSLDDKRTEKAGGAGPRPRNSLHMGHGVQSWAYSTGGANESLARGVYAMRGERWVQVAPLPFVLGRIAHRDNSGRRTGTSYRLAMTAMPDAADVAVVHSAELRDGSWRDLLGIVMSHDEKITKVVVGAIQEIAEQVPEHEATPRWRAGELELPPLDFRPEGYGVTSPSSPDAARAGWAEIGQLAQRNPRLALLFGASLGSLYVSPLSLLSHIVLLTGTGGMGKTTALRGAAGVLGRPGTEGDPQMVLTFNSTMNGVAARLGELTCLPAYFDELTASGLGPRDLETLVLRISAGASRLQARRTQGSRSTSAWSGTLFSTGNATIAGRVSNDAVARRMIEIPVPVVGSARESDRLACLIEQHYGWPLAWLLKRGMDLAGFRERIDAAREQIGPTLDGGPAEESVARTLAVAVAGAQLLGELVGVPFAEQALHEAQQRLYGVADQLSERGANPGDRLIEAVRSMWVARPGACPSRSEWANALERGEPLRRDTEAFDVTGDASLPGDLAVRASALAAIATEAGIEDPEPGIADLVARGVLIRQSGRRTYDVKMLAPARAQKARCYLFAFPADDPPADQPPAGGDQPAPTLDRPVTSDNAADEGPQDGPHSPDSPQLSGDYSTLPLTCDDETPVPAVPAVPTDSGTCRAHEGDGALDDDVIDPNGHCGPVVRVAGTGPCRACGGGPVPFVDDCGHVHPFTCAQGQIAAPPPPRSEPPPQSRPEPSSPRTRGDRPARRSSAPQRGSQRRPGSGELISAADELAAFGAAVRQTFPDAPDDAIERALALWHQVTDGMAFVGKPSGVALAAYHRLRGKHPNMVAPVPLASDKVAELRAGLAHARDYLVASAALPDDAHVTALDVNAQFLGAARSVVLGDGEPTIGAKDPERIILGRETPGYVTLRAKTNTKHPGFGEDHSGVLPRGSVLTTQTARYLIKDRKVRLPIGEIVYWPDNGKRLDVWSKYFGRAYLSLKARDNIEARYALTAVKQVYTSFLTGMLASKQFNHTDLYRPDWADMVRTLAEANMFRALDKIAVSPVGIYRDTAWFFGTGPEPAVPEGLTIDLGPGKWKLSGCVPMIDALRDAHAQASPSLFDEAFKCARREGD